MFRFIVLVLVLAAGGLAYTNPTEDVVRAKLNEGVAGMSGMSQSGGGVPDILNSALAQKAQGKLGLTRQNYYLFSLYKVSVAGSAVQMPGCLIGIAGQAIPYDKC